MFIENDNDDMHEIELFTYIVDNTVKQKWYVKRFNQQLFSQRDDAVKFAETLKRIANDEYDNQMRDANLANAVGFYDKNGKELHDNKNAEYAIKEDSKSKKCYVITMNACYTYFPIFDSYYEAERWIRLKTGYNGAA